jgi:hypothetical protein
MNRETIEKILNFLKEKENKESPKKWKLIHELETYPDGTQYRHKYDLYLINSNITKLPNDLYVEYSLNLRDSIQLTKLPDNLHVEGNLTLWDCNQLTELPDNLYVGGSLGLGGTNITELPNNLYVGINLYINNTPLAKKYTDEEIEEIVTSTGGKIEGNIYRE